MSMAAILKQFDLYTATKETGVKFWLQLQQQRAALDKNVNVDDLRKTLQIFKKGVSRKDFPGGKSEAGNVCEDVLREIINCINKLDPQEDASNGTEKFYLDCFDFVIELFESGPGTTHLKLLEILRGYCHGYRRWYNRTTNAKTIRPLLKALAREFTSEEPNFQNDRHYNYDLVTALHSVMDKKRHPRALNTGTAIQKYVYTEAQEEFLELYMYHETSFLSRPDDVLKNQRYASQMICSMYEMGPFHGIQKPEIFRRHLQRLNDVIKEKKFPHSEEKLKIIQDVLAGLLSGIIAGKLVSDLAHDVLKFLVEVCTVKQIQSILILICEVGKFYNNCKDAENLAKLKANSGLLETIIPTLVQFLDNLKDSAFFNVTVVKPIVCNIICTCMNNSKEHLSLMMKLLKSLVKISNTQCIDTAQTVLEMKEKFLKWKSHVVDAQEILDIISKEKITQDHNATKEELTRLYARFLSGFLDQAKRDRVLKDLNERMVNYSLKCMESRSPFMFQMGSEVVDRVDFYIKKEKDLMFRALRTLRPLLEDEKFPWALSTSRNIAQKLSAEAMDAIQDSKVLTGAELQSLIVLTETVIEREFIHPDTNTPDTVFYSLYKTVGTRVVKMIDDEEKAAKATKLISKIVALIDSEYEEIHSLSISHIATVCLKVPVALKSHMGRMVDVYVADENTDLLDPISKVYPYNPNPFKPHFQTFFDLIDSRDDDVRSLILTLLQEVAHCQPQLYEDKHISTIIDEMESASDKEQVGYLNILMGLSKQRPKTVASHSERLLTVDIHKPGLPVLIGLLKNVAVNSKQNQAERIMEYYVKLLSGPEDGELSPLILNEMRSVGAVHRPTLESRKPFIANLNKITKVQPVRDICTFILDVLEGRSLEGLSVDMQGVKKEVGQLGQEVTSTKVKVQNVENNVTEQKKRVDHVEVRVDHQGREIRELEGTVEATVEKVEEIDKKTLSHAPFWARDVSKLLNPEDKHDWRLLSSRLGYSNDDIRGWAQTPDPCQSMLNEWYTTHKTRDATFGVLQALNEMNRTDAAAIVENAMKMAETVVEDDPVEYKTPPPIFISYQWGKQPEVQTLQRHLEAAGYSCWLDIGQMGGGDKLFQKIDQGIRSAKVVLCCVTDKYAESPNCNREVNLAVNLGKPMIPLLLEKSTWPPAGSMGPIFSEYLFIRMFSRPGEECKKDVFWPKAKFRELLMQLSYNKVEPSLSVDKEYKNWWLSVAVTTPSSQNKSKTDNKISGGADKKALQKSPDVFLSYQWGKQPQIQNLYARLTSLGYNCWMDIFQMGGGDSLFDKIDKGVRGAKVVICCVTAKYCLSANCRREVTLADALKKPIVPLLLEPLAWPPSGPMSMVLTPLAYIDFSGDERMQESWKGNKADELFQKIEGCISPGKEEITHERSEPKENRNQGEITPKQYNSRQNSQACLIL